MNKIRWLIVFSVLVFISLPVSADDTVIWNNPKTINHAKLNMTAPQEFNTCIISPDGGSGWDTCTAFIIVGNNFQHLPTGQLNFNSFWRKGNVRNVQYQYTKTWYDSFIIDNDSTTPIKVFSGFTSSVPQVNIGEYFAVKMVFEKRSYTSDFFDFTAHAGSDSITLDPDVAACGNLNTNDAIYTQIADISSATDCLTISGNNITFNGAGYEIYYNGGGVTGRGIILTGSNITVANSTIIKNSAANVVNIESIYINGGNGNNTVINNSIVANTTNGRGIYINKRFNNISLNNIIATNIGLHADTLGSDNIFYNNVVNSSSQTILISSDNNSFYNNAVQSSDIGINIGLGFDNVTISGGDVQSNYTGATNDDYFINNVFYKYMVINQTNFTTRFIGYGGNNAKFNYSNGSGVFVDSRLSASKRSSRTLYNWTQSNITWSDNVTVTTATAFYNVSGLITNKYYHVYNNSYQNFTLQTDSFGVLPVFSMNLTTSQKNFSVLANNPPSITGISSSYTIQSQTTLTITPTITDPDNDIVSLNSTNATLGSFDSATGILTFTPGIDQTGTYYWNITATDSLGDSTTSAFSITVVNNPYQDSCNNTNNDTNVAFGLVGVLLIITSAFGIIATIRGQNMVILISFIGVGIFGSILLVIGIFITSTISNGLC